MYCSNCGANNLAGAKFCTRCGEGLAATSPVMGEGGVTQIDERVIKLIKDYYRGRRDTITGAVLIPAGMLIMAILVVAGMPAIASFFIICWMFFWGASSLASGLGKWIASSGELKTLGYDMQQSALPRSAREQIAPPGQRDPQGSYSTGPVNIPASVTEQTTRQLDEKAFRPVEHQSKQS